ncbi:MAG: PIN domain-containing protein, partial [Thermotogota bacterium]|nr:PIN domain-containing protein [Thermotogota bacterium]
NIFYVLKRSINDYKKVYNYIRLLLEILTIIDVNSDDIFRALDAESNDFEDELISVCAYKANVDFIISRNSKDFKNQKSKRLNLKSFSINNFKKSFLQSPPSLWIVSFLGHQRIWEPFHGK